MKKILIALAIALVLVLLASGGVLAAVGIDNWQAFLETQQAMLKGFKEYLSALIELFQVAIQ